MAGKFLVILAAVAGVVAFFVPLLEVEQNGRRGRFKPFVLVTGLRSTGDILDKRVEDPEEDRRQVAAFNEKVAEMSKGMMVTFAPVAGLLLVALLSLFARYGRGLASLALVFGLLAGGVWFLLHQGFEKADPSVERGVGMTLLLAAAALGVLGGILGLIAPQPRRMRLPPPDARVVV